MGNKESTPIVTYETVCHEYEDEKMHELLLYFKGLCPNGLEYIPKEIILQKFREQIPLLDEFMIHRLFYVFNIIQNDKMSFQEFVVMIYVLNNYDDNYRLTVMFRLLDLDGDGYLSKTDFKKTFIKILSGREVTEWVSKRGNSSFKYSLEDFNPIIDAMSRAYTDKVDVHQWIESRCSSVEVSRIIDLMKCFEIGI